MAATFYIKQNDTAPSIEVILTDSAGKAKSLADVDNVKFNMQDENGNLIIDHGAGYTTTPLGRGIVGYAWQDGDTANEGMHKAEFVITYTNGQVETFPNTSYINVIVKADLA